MIDLKAHYIAKATSKWQRFKINYGLESLPADYACRTIQDFVLNKDKLKIQNSVIFPKATYYPDFVDDQVYGDKIKVELGDETGRIYVKVRPTCVNIEEGEMLTDSILKLKRGDTMYFPVIRNGFYLSEGIFQPEFIDDTPYLLGFQHFKIRKKGKNETNYSFSPEFGSLKAIPIR